MTKQICGNNSEKKLGQYFVLNIFLSTFSSVQIEQYSEIKGARSYPQNCSL